MKTPTIKDIAEKAGVSQGTVSNVLNGRGNVSLEKILLVESAADKLGYRINTRAQLLRKGKANTLLFIIPSTEYTKYSDMYEVFSRKLNEYGYTVQIYSTDSTPLQEMEALNNAMMSRVAAIVAVIGLEPQNRYLRMAADRIPIVLVDNHVSAGQNTLLAGFDYGVAGVDIARNLNEKNYKNVVMFLSEKNRTNVIDLATNVTKEFKGKLKIIYSRDQMVDSKAFAVFEALPEIDAIVCGDDHRARAVIRAQDYTYLKPLPEIITISSYRGLSDGSLRYELDYKNLADNIVQRMIKNKKTELMLPNHGFKQSVSVKKKLDDSLEFLTVSSPSSEALQKLLPHFKKQTGIDVKLTVVGLQDIYKKMQQMDENLQYDLVRMDMAWMPELAEKVYAPLDEVLVNHKSIKQNILPFFLKDYTYYNDKFLCLPYDPSTQVLFYRKDIFEDPTIKRMYYEHNKELLKVPETFEQYNRIARFFTRRYNAESPVMYGTTTAIGNSVVSPSEYLPRLFGEKGELFDSEGKIDLETTQAIDALHNYVETHKYSDRVVYQWWKDALEGFSDGNVAMTIVFLNYASDIIISDNYNIAGKIGFAKIPGRKPLIGGGVIGVNRYSKKKELAALFLEWLYSSKISPALTMLGGLSPSKYAYDNTDATELYPWISAAMSSFPIAHHRVHNELYTDFSEKKLEDILSKHVKGAVLGQVTPEQALKRAQQECLQEFTPVE